MRPALARLLQLGLPALLACTPAESTNPPAPAPTPVEPAEPTTPAEPAEPAEPDADAGGFADPKLGVDPPPPTPAQPPQDPALAARVREKFGERCKLERSCGELLGVDCGAAVDGPYSYVQRADLKTVATCGGACMTGRCTDCPPKAWTCPTY